MGDNHLSEADRRLRAAHDRLERECIRTASTSDSDSVSLSVAGSEIVYRFVDVLHAVTWFDLLTYGEALKRRKLIRGFEAAYPRIVFSMDASARASLMGYASPVEGATSFDASEIPLESREAAPTSAEVAAPQAVLTTQRPAPPPGNFPPPTEIMKAILTVVAVKPLYNADILEHASQILGYPLAQAIAAGTTPDGVSVSRTFDRMFHMLRNSSLLARKGKAYALTPEARRRFASGDLGLECEPIMEAGRPGEKRKKKPKEKRLPIDPVIAETGLGQMKHEELVSLWKNAVKILANALKKKQHGQARIMMARVTKEWEIRAKSETGYFKWPTTVAKGGNGKLAFDAEKEGMLSFLEYHVGNVRGEPESVRRLILRRVFECTLPPVAGREYMAQWGENASPKRLHKMAVSIASFARMFKRRRSSSFDDAIREWVADLEFLRVTYYVKKFGFGWPTTAI